MLTVPNARVSDSGVYYCVARFTDGTNSSQSNESFVNITGKYISICNLLYSLSPFYDICFKCMFLIVLLINLVFVCVSFYVIVYVFVCVYI